MTKPLRAITTEQIVPMGEQREEIYASVRCFIRLDDEGGGPFLTIHGENDDARKDESQHSFYLQSHEEIDQFAAICHQMLAQAEEAQQ